MTAITILTLSLLAGDTIVEPDGNVWPQHPAVQICIDEKLTPKECAFLVKGIEWRELAINRTHQLAQCEETYATLAKPAPSSLWSNLPSLLVIAGAALGAGLVLGYVAK